MNWYKLQSVEKTANATFQGTGYTASVMAYSNKGPLVIVSLTNGQEARCYYDLATKKWKPLS